MLVKDINPGPPSGISDWWYSYNDNYYPEQIQWHTWGVLANGQLIFEGQDDVSGLSVWRSDATSEGTVTLQSSFGLSKDLFIHSVADFNGMFVFDAFDSQSTIALWRSDGSEAGTTLISPTLGMDSAPGILNNSFIFSYNNKLWRSDGTASGTVAFKELDNRISAATQFTPLNGALFFAYNNALWRTDGTASGTSQVSQVSPYNLVAFNGLLYFSSGSTSGGLYQGGVWRSDGTPQGTYAFKPFLGSQVAFATLDDNLFFSFVGANFELWKTQGTAQTTSLVTFLPRDQTYDRTKITQTSLTRSGRLLFFVTLDQEHGEELWASDGTQAGTRLVRDIFPGSGSASPRDLTDVDGVLYFSAVSPEGGRELWRSDGTEAGTTQIKDSNPGSAGSNPKQFTSTSAGLFFVAANAM